MNRFARQLPSILICLLVLAACTHSRIVERDYPGASDRHGRTDRRSSPGVTRASPARLPRGSVHVVRSGETLYGISFRYGLRYQDVAAWNGIYDPYVIEIGQQLRLRPGNEILRGPRRVPDRVATDAGRTPMRPAPPSTRPAADVLPGTAATSTIAVPTFGAPSWRWPAQGAVIGRYVAGDQTRQGIDIAGSAGQKVAAAAEGVVVYSGAGLVGYGELIIIKHSEEWLSAYAHNRRRLVSEGARVKAGDVIAEMGRSGAPREMLHFEIRRNGKPVDPLAHLPRP